MSIFNLPDLGEGLPDAEIHEWHVKEGDIVKTDVPLVSMETAKAVVDVPCPHDGVIKKLYGTTGDTIQTGNPLVEFTSETESKDEGTVVGKIPSTGETLDETSSISKSSTSHNIKVTPAVRAIAKKLAVDLNLVTPTGKNNLITADDVNDFANKMLDSGTLIPLKGVRKSMAITMSHAHAEVVPVTITEDIILESDSSNLTVRIIMALVKAVQSEPNLNSWYNSQAMSMRVFDNIDLGLAMDTLDGLFVPVIHNSEKLSASDIRSKINEYKVSVTDRTVDQNDLKNPTIILSNFGSIAGKYASPIVVPPTVAILGIGKLREVIAPVDGAAKVCELLPVSLTFDHRAITGGEASRFIGAFAEAL